MVSILLGVAAPVAAQGASSSGAAFHVGFGASISTVTGTVAPLFLFLSTSDRTYASSPKGVMK
jgi:hypothetical protein